MLNLQYQRGVYLPDQDLWLDPWEAQRFAFVSHAHSDHIAPHGEILMSPGTSRLMAARMPGERREHLLPFGQTRNFADFAATLLPAGHIFGSAQIHLEAEGGSLLYTGDFKLRQGLSAERAEWRTAETLIMETTYGLPKYRMPPTDEVLAQMVAFCQEALAEGHVPILLGYSLGKAQEILCALMRQGLTPMLHGSVFRMTEIYRELNPDFPCDYVRYAPGELEGKVLVCPPSANRSLMLQRIKQRRTAILTGWALDPDAKFRYGCDAAFPLTDHADYPDLLRYVDLVQPKRVLTLHGFAAAFARDLRERGVEAWALSEVNQLEFTFKRPGGGASGAGTLAAVSTAAGVISPAGAEPRPAHPGSFAAFAGVAEAIGATPSRLKKIRALAEYLAALAEIDPRQAAAAAIYFTGRAFPQSDNRTLQTGGAVIRRALLAASGRTEEQLRDIARQHRDAGKTAYEALLGRPGGGQPDLREVRAFFNKLQEARGPIQKGELLAERLATLSPAEGGCLVKILTGDLRIGLKEGLVEEAIAEAFEASLEAVRECHMLLGDLGETTALAHAHRLSDAAIQLFRPIKCMLASPEPSSEAVWARLEESRQPAPPAGAGGAEPGPSFWAEDKYDGMRAQMHLGAGRVEIFTRDLRMVTDQFGDLAAAARAFRGAAILDGEIMAFAEGRTLTFFDLQKRLGRKTEDDLFLERSDVPVIFRIFDLLYLEGRSLLREPLRTRRALLESLSYPAVLQVAPIAEVHSVAEVEAAFGAARRRGNEGLITKDGASAYSPGRRGSAWLKLKKELATLDVVVVGAESGHGKRSGVLSDYTFAVRDEPSGDLLTIGKAYSGVTDEEIDELTEHFLQTTVAQHGSYRQVRPEVVLEVAFDSVQESGRHNSGLALRFPRIKAIRRDKGPDAADTLAYARSLLRGKANG